MMRNALSLWNNTPWQLKFSLVMTVLGVFCVALGYVWWRKAVLEDTRESEKVLFELGDDSSRVVSAGVQQEILPTSSASSQAIAQSRLLVVGVVGMVAKPGLYELPEGSRVMDALHRAGGLTQAAKNDPRLLSLNIARRLTDGETIAVGGDAVRELRDGVGEGESLALGVGNSDGSKTISINTATQSELERLPGIGPKYAQKMIEKRPFINPQDVRERTGIPEGVLAKVFPLISYGE